MLQHLADGRVDVMVGRGNTGPVYPWFGKDVRDGIALAVENYALLHQLWREEAASWTGLFRTPLQSFTSAPRPLDGVPPFVWHGSIRSPEIAEQAAYHGDGFFHNNIFWPADHTRRLISLYRSRYAFYGHGEPIVGLGGQVFMRRRSLDAVAEFRPFFDRSPVYGGGPSLEETMRQTPLSVGSPQEIIDRTLQLFNVDEMGLSHSAALDQIEFLGEIVPVLRKEFALLRPSHVPDTPTHASLRAGRS